MSWSLSGFCLCLGLGLGIGIGLCLGLGLGLGFGLGLGLDKFDFLKKKFLFKKINFRDLLNIFISFLKKRIKRKKKILVIYLAFIIL